MRLAWVGPLLAVAAAAQPITVGVKGGAVLTGDIDSFFAVSESKRYTAGPMVTVGLPAGFRVEVDALFRRVGYRSEGPDIFGGSYYNRYIGNSWEFPMLLRHGLVRGLFVGAGYAPRRIHGSGRGVYVFRVPPNGFSYNEYDLLPGWRTTHGFVAAAGIERRIGPLRVAPEVRYTYWTSPAVEEYGPRGYSVVERQHRVGLLLGVSFP